MWQSGQSPSFAKSVVVALFLLRREPDAAEEYDSSPGGTATRSCASDGLAIGRAAAVRDPDARAGAHHRLERGDEAAGRVTHSIAAVGLRSWMYGSRFAKHDDALAEQAIAAASP